MPPNISDNPSTKAVECNGDLNADKSPVTGKSSTQTEHHPIWTKEGWRETFTFMTPLIWYNIIAISLYHFVAVVAAFVYIWIGQWSIRTIIFGFVMGGISGFGVTGGAHRLWTHRSYKANTPLRIILMICFSVAGQNPLYDWVRDHRVHHKYSETHADPHNSNRGFFFSHVGWLMMRKHPEVLRKGKTIDMSDILGDPVIQFHHRNFALMKALCCFIIPTIIPVYFWNESWLNAIISQPIIRYVISLNNTWSVNSFAHIMGTKPYDRRISPVENKYVSFMAMGEGWHNYHHSFPWDYKAAELGGLMDLNLTTFIIDQFAKIGWAYDLKQPSQTLVRKVIEASGDGTHKHYGHVEVPEDVMEQVEEKEKQL